MDKDQIEMEYIQDLSDSYSRGAYDALRLVLDLKSKGISDKEIKDQVKKMIDEKASIW